MDLLVDIGNTRIKWAVLSHDALLEVHAKAHSQHDVLGICKTLFKQPDIEQIVLVHVLGAKFDHSIRNLADKFQLDLLIVHSQLNFYGIKTNYLEPHKLGTDRFVAMLAAHRLFQQHDCLVIDCGTAVTIDAITSSGEHQGGVIFLGLQLCEDSLIAKTNNLKNLQYQLASVQTNLFATSTAQGVKTGCYYSLAATIDRICQEMEDQMLSLSPIKKILCGGDAECLYPWLRGNYELNEHLVLEGLKFIRKL